MTKSSVQPIPQAFIWRRLHSITGLWLVGFIMTHLFTNSQAALFIGDDGHGFISAVNSIHDLPYLLVIEFIVLAFPILLHMAWGIKYLRSAEYNSFGKTGKTPYLPEYPRNHAYTWQRITSWLLVVGIIAHVVHMRFMDYPVNASKGTEHNYMVRISADEGLHSLSERLGVQLYNSQQIESFKKKRIDSSESPSNLLANQEEHWQQSLSEHPLKSGELIAVANNFGTAELLMVRDTFKSPFMLVLYTLLVLAACFHAFNGLWTFMISWGVTLSVRAQKLMSYVSTLLMIVFALLGLSAVWLTYWINLKQ